MTRRIMITFDLPLDLLDAIYAFIDREAPFDILKPHLMLKHLHKRNEFIEKAITRYLEKQEVYEYEDIPFD